jgi:hypothetical protein
MTLPLVGYYAGGWIWPDDQIDWVKSLLPFFDKLSLILPPELLPQAVRDDDVIAQPLIDLGVLETRNPTDVLDDKATTVIVESIRRIITERQRERGFDVEEGRSLAEFAELVTAPEKFQTITATHFGIYDREVEKLLRDLQARGLASALDPKTRLLQLEGNLRAAVVAVCAQTMCLVDRANGLDVVPFRPPTGRSAPGRWSPAFVEILSGDLANVGVDLSRMPLADVLAFRNEHLAAYTQYMRDLRSMVRLVDTATDQPDLQRLMRDRQAELRGAADSLRRKARRSGIKTGLGVGLGLVGAGLTFGTGAIAGGAVAAVAAAVGLIPDSQADSPYTYLFKLARS